MSLNGFQYLMFSLVCCLFDTISLAAARYHTHESLVKSFFQSLVVRRVNLQGSGLGRRVGLDDVYDEIRFRLTTNFTSTSTSKNLNKTFRVLIFFAIFSFIQIKTVFFCINNYGTVLH